MNLGFVILYVSDMQKVQTFYTDLVGLSVWQEHSGPGFTSLRPAKGTTVGLQDKKTANLPPKQESASGTVELSFEVDNVDETYRTWQANGVEIVSEPEDMPFGRYFLAKDPEGHFVSAFRYK
jgi:predicted enzyme related to lactoylglutathione lyase